MAPQSDHLVKIGEEGFDLIEQFYGPAPTRRSTAAASAVTGGLRAQVMTTKINDHIHSKEEAAMINSKDAAYRYNGVVIVDDPSKAKPRCRWGKIFRFFKF